MRIIAFITNPLEVAKILEHIGDGVLRAQQPFLRILRGVKSHGDTFLKGTAP
jgi:hypothetical protein